MLKNKADNNFNDNNAKHHKRFTLFKPKMKKNSFLVSVLINVIRFLIIISICIVIAGVGIIAGIAKAYVETAPYLDIDLINNQAKTSFIYDSNGKLITDYKGIENRIAVSIDSIPKKLQYAFVAVEDARFFKHNGVDIKRIAGAFLKNLRSGSNQGGSTITQQLIKNTVLSSELSYKRKIQEAYLSVQLEQKYTKEQILESYLNTIYLGENYYGVKVAANGYFGKELNQLSLRECAMLAGITSNPDFYNPRKNFYTRNSADKDFAKNTNNRTNYVLRAMYENQFITEAEYLAALETSTANVLQEGKINALYKYPHYIEYAIEDVINVFLKLNNLENTQQNRRLMENKIRTGGYHIKLAIDTEIQDIVEDTLENWGKYPKTANKDDSVIRSKNKDGSYQEIIQPQAAAVVLDYRTGELKAIVGSRTRPTQLKTLNRAYNMHMPVGSSIKPISVYGPALDLGASPASIVYNIPVPIQGWLNDKKQNSYPKNYGGGSYTGAETLREAMKRSHNTSTANALMLYVGVNNSVNYLKSMGISEKSIDPTPFGLALGSSGITPIEMATAYGVIGNSGVYQAPISFLGISDSNGNVIYDSHKEQERHQVFKPSTAYMLVDMLKDVVNYGTGTKAKIKGQVVAGKTGTNSQHRGVTFAGLTGYYASSIWVGHDNYKALHSKSTGGSSAAPIWQSYMSKIHSQKGLDNKEIIEGSPSDYNLIRVSTSTLSGQLATEACYNDTQGYSVVNDLWLRGTEPNVECQMHKKVQLCTTSNELAGPFCPPETVVDSSVIIIPDGHPLSSLKNTQYADILEQYFGRFANLDSINSIPQCSIHTSSGAAYPNTTYNTNETNTYEYANVINEASNLLAHAEQVLNHYNYDSNEYRNLSNAINNLRNSLGSNDYNFILGLMQNLTNILSTIN